MDKFDFGLVTEDDICYREQMKDSDILYIESPEKCDRHKYDRRVFYNDSSIVDKEIKCDLMSHRNRRIYIEKQYRYNPSGLNTTESDKWDHIFFDDDYVYCVEYHTQFLREKLKDRKLEVLPNYTAGNFVYFKEVFDDIQDKNATLIFKEDKQTWIKAIQSRGGLGVNEFLQEIDETLKTEERKEEGMNIINITMAGGSIAVVEGRIVKIVDSSGRDVISYCNPEAKVNDEKYNNSVPTKKKKVKSSYTQLKKEAVCNLIVSKFLGSSVSQKMLGSYLHDNNMKETVSFKAFNAAIALLARNTDYKVTGESGKFVITRRVSLSQPQHAGN